MNSCQKTWISFSVAAMILLGSSGCATTNYQYGIGEATQPTPIAHPSAKFGNVFNNKVSVGGDHPTVDRIEKMVQTPRRVVGKLFNKEPLTEAETEEARQESIAISQEFLQANGLGDVKIDVRCYEPAEQWRRLKANDEIAPIWKYTGGTINHIGYTLLPRRAFHSNSYNPFTNTLSLNSTDAVDAIYHAADAKQHQKHKHVGAYAMAQRLPVVPIFHTAAVSQDVIGYAKAKQDWELEKKLYPATYSRVGATAVRQAVNFGAISNTAFPRAPLLQLAGRSVGNVTGRLVAKQRESENARLADVKQAETIEEPE